MPPTLHHTAKQLLRREMKNKRQQLSETQYLAYNQYFMQEVEKILRKRKVKTLHTFLPIGREPDTRLIVQMAFTAGIQIIVPKTAGKRQLTHLVLTSLENLSMGRFGTAFPENAPLFVGSPDLIIVPGLAFDSNGHRLGYGGGYYDTFLSAHPKAYTLALAYPFQLLPNIPAEAHDITVNQVIVAPKIE